jgi:A/G-specific adenine glycosylase
VRQALLRWYRRNRRDLPWRRTRDPYAVWVSEVMLQQTRVAVVVPYFEKFLRRFPGVRALARASDDEVLALWSGLGYYRRARALLAGARMVVERHRGRIPDDPEALRRLPGIGRYTAGAIASVAFDREEAVLDGNVRRVLSRLFAVSLTPPARQERWLWETAASLVQGRDPGDLNQALMELGATVCRPRAPACGACPLARRCKARAEGRPEAFPQRRPRHATVAVRVAVAVVLRRGRVLLERPAPRSPLRGAWDLPAIEIPDHAGARAAIEDMLRMRHGIEIESWGRVARARHAILDRRLRLDILSCRPAAERKPGQDARWHPLRRLDEVPISGATRKALALVTGAPTEASTVARAGGGRSRPRARAAARNGTIAPP